VSTAEYNTLDQFNPDQLAQLSLIRMPNGTIGRLQQLQGGGMNFQPLEVELEQMRTWAQKIAEQAISEQDITWRTIYKKVAMSPEVFMCNRACNIVANNF
jgi:hypothetical protein